MLDVKFINEVEDYVRELFKAKLGNEVLYHTINHTIDVVNAVEVIGKAESISEDDLEILLIAAWFHDTGHFHCCTGHEEQSNMYAREYLEKHFYPSEKIEKILDCIRSTKISQNPKNKLEEIICDADLLHLGEKNIKERGDLLREEFELRGIKKLSDIEWMNHSIAFFNQHRFFTEYAKKNYGLQKEKNLEIMKDYLDLLIKSESDKNRFD
jgi:predicted metal-dependent HD superfamily phosphohydrolase